MLQQGQGSIMQINAVESTKIKHYWKCYKEKTAQIARSRSLWDCFLKDLMLRLANTPWEYLRN